MSPNINMSPSTESLCEIIELEPEINLSNFSLDEKEDAGDVIQEAAFILGRCLPNRLDLLYRKYYKVKNSDTTYAFGVLAENRKEVEGSVGWTVQMAIQLQKHVFVFDVNTHQWYKGDRFEARLPDSEFKTLVNRFVSCQPPSLDQKSNISLPVCFGNPTSYELEQLLARRC